ncbi:unnamed protein product [Brassica oleracea var. botrytis]
MGLISKRRTSTEGEATSSFLKPPWLQLQGSSGDYRGLSSFLHPFSVAMSQGL